ELGAGTPTTTPTTADPAAEPAAGPATGPSATAPAAVPPRLKRQFDELKAQTAEIRGLQWQAPLDLRVVSRKELSRMVREVVARDTDPKQVAGEEATLKLLHLIPENLDFGQLMLDLLAEQVLGYYDPITRQLVVGTDGDEEELDGGTKWVIVHEMNHALTDQVFNYGPPTDALYKADKADEAAAYSALLEGDAVIVQDLWADKYLSDEEQLLIALGGVGSGNIEVYLNAPPYVREDLAFPYGDGQEFVQGLYDAGGFAAIDAAYRRPPTSTEQILHPEAYRAGQASTPPALPNLAAATGCTSLRTGTLGQFDMEATLDLHLSDSEASRAVEGWNGDAYAVVRCGSAVGLAERWQTDPGTDAARLADSLTRWAAQWSGSGRAPGADGRFSGPGGTGRIVRNGNRVDLVLAQDAATADKLTAALAS
ncbi:MAG: hypothetical protein ACRD12_02100, partial [Acidimicrobiales bacterium]